MSQEQFVDCEFCPNFMRQSAYPKHKEKCRKSKTILCGFCHQIILKRKYSKHHEKCQTLIIEA